MPVEMYDEAFSLHFPTMEPWVLAVCFALFGACIGSFLNVVIYRVPRGLSVNDPKRSFCPTCKTPIPWYHNLPVISWLVLRGKSACCHTRISCRYWLVEVGTALLFGAVAWNFAIESLPVIVLLCAWSALMLAILCIDWELMVVLPGMAATATVLGLTVGVLAPWLVDAQLMADSAGDGLMWSAAGAVSGFVLLKGVGIFGKLLFGKKRKQFEEPVAWSLHQKGEDLELSLGEETMLWSDIFMEEGNRLTLEDATLPGLGCKEAGAIVFSIDGVTLPDGTQAPLEKHESLEGTCKGLQTHKEAMGSGDAWIAMAIGAVCGWQGVLFALVAGSVIGILQAIVCRVGRGTPMPFGPAFIAGAFIWLFWGTQLLVWYWGMVG